MMQIPDARAIMVQPMLKGTELFIGGKHGFVIKVHTGIRTMPLQW